MKENWTSQKREVLTAAVVRYFETNDMQKIIDDCRLGGIKKASIGAINAKIGGFKDSEINSIAQRLQEMHPWKYTAKQSLHVVRVLGRMIRKAIKEKTIS